MKKIFYLLFLIFSSVGNLYSDNIASKWITVSDADVNSANKWVCFRKDISINNVPGKVMTKIAVDSKYWLWVNGKMVIFEGGLKRGPNPQDTYYDEIDLAPFLKKGKNEIAVLLWHFGKDGFSHKNSGKAGFIMHSGQDGINLSTDHSWLCKMHPAYANTEAPFPNYRLPESNIRYDANKEMIDWQTADCEKIYGFTNAVEIGSWGSAPWNNLVKRPIPFWKDFGVKSVGQLQRIKGNTSDTIIGTLPYNMQMTPILEIVDSKGGELISICTDHLHGGSETNLRAEYITKQGKQEYESLGWLNGQKIYLVVPSHIQVNSLKYRETGYNASPQGAFTCEDDFFMRFWNKALRTIYINMRDTYFDCPDRERAQWWGDVVMLMGESFYTYSESTHLLMKKAIKELVGWQKPDGVLYSPIPSGNYDQELPGQMLASIGYYGFWNYYMNTGDLETIKEVYPAVKKYLSLWSLDRTGLTAYREGGWAWGDWGNNRDMRLIFAGWHYLALKGAALMADKLGYIDDASNYRAIMGKVSGGYNACWDGTAYRHPEYKGKTDDRVQALAVISGIANHLKYSEISKVFRTEFHASPYMEKYVMEALFIMGEGDYGLERMKKRFSPMVNNIDYTTLFEGWEVGGFGGGTVNHAWSGGALTVISQYLCGIYPLEPGYKVFKVEPCLTALKSVSLTIPSVKGEIKSSYTYSEKGFTLNITVPRGTKGIIYLPEDRDWSVSINKKPLDEKQYSPDPAYKHKTKQTLSLSQGNYIITMKK
ncbi:glycoside hydrolase [Dysgonomonas sp. Marseille-P4677]|uniref:alpha-L-rhamnosidase-related protein n=1 Tax=Dysgonomonas sp. Marseille-P4677 TaxID=2364790 RepID=UPI0019126645|nr:alpha-L-rhamnosidase C-terminal domain-containing protein [Dysgonomonas sp. Marseille-P4677]MBK5719416.1 glycoside hydrolase [Dysgonomonas sp. Marseille-P4677]